MADKLGHLVMLLLFNIYGNSKVTVIVTCSIKLQEITHVHRVMVTVPSCKRWSDTEYHYCVDDAWVIADDVLHIVQVTEKVLR